MKLISSRFESYLGSYGTRPQRSQHVQSVESKYISNAVRLFYEDVPTLTSITPIRGTKEGGTEITINGGLASERRTGFSDLVRLSRFSKRTNKFRYGIESRPLRGSQVPFWDYGRPYQR